MKLTKTQLKQIIKEELSAATNDQQRILLKENIEAFPGILKLLTAITRQNDLRAKSAAAFVGALENAMAALEMTMEAMPQEADTGIQDQLLDQIDKAIDQLEGVINQRHGARA